MIKKIILYFSFALAALGLFHPAIAADDAASSKISDEEFLASLKFQSGKITLPGAVATLNLPASFRYLSPADAERVLVEAWGNPRGSQSLGMIVPTDVSPLTEAGWGVVITYDKDGYVKDDEADSINYDDLLKKLQEETSDGNADRKKQGYAPMSLVGWAEKPYYDKNSHKLYWAQELHVDGSRDNSLNYNVRLLGRHGVLVLNAVSGMKQITEIKSEMQKVIAFSEFTDGNRYADFNSKTDKVAEYGLAALVAGTVATKLGLFGKLFALLLAFKKLIFVGLAALGGGIMKLFGGSKDK